MWKFFVALIRCAPRILATFTFYLWRYAKHPEKYPMELRYKHVRTLIQKVIHALKVDQKVEGIENLRSLEEKDQRFLLVSNHLAAIDPLLFIYHSEKPITFVGKKELEKMPFVRTVIKAIDGMFLDRNDLRNGLQIIRNVENLIKNNVASVAIFPEGTRNKNPNGELPEFHGGTFKPAFRINCPVLPASHFGSQYILGKKSLKRSPYEINFFEALSVKGNTANSVDFAKNVHDMVAEKMYEQREEDRLFFAEHKEKIPMRKGPVR